MAIRASGLDYRALAAYLVDGTTWNRHREIATTSVPQGGLALFRDGSPECKAIFGKSPGAIISSRPDTDLQFLKLLEGKEHVLHKLATKDLEQRSLSAETKAAIRNLGDIKARINRRILAELIERCFFLLYWNGHHTTVASETSWDTLMNLMVSGIMDLEISEKVLERFSTTEEDLVAMDPRPKTWVELAVYHVVQERDLVAERLPEALEFHRKVSDQAGSHLKLLADNTFRTPWIAAKLLSKNKTLARDSAVALVKHLVTTRPGNRTSFENHLFNTEPLWKALEEFSKAEPPVLLWHGRQQYEALFKFLAPRFLLAPDHVLDAERVHARWQWHCNERRALKIHTLNATLRLVHYMENNQNFPSMEDLLPNLDAERQQHRLALEALDAEG